MQTLARRPQRAQGVAPSQARLPSEKGTHEARLSRALRMRYSVTPLSSVTSFGPAPRSPGACAPAAADDDEEDDEDDDNMSWLSAAADSGGAAAGGGAGASGGGGGGGGAGAEEGGAEEEEDDDEEDEEKKAEAPPPPESSDISRRFGNDCSEMVSLHCF